MKDANMLAIVIGRMRADDKSLTYRDLLAPAMEVQTKRGAQLFMREYIAHLMRCYKQDRKRALYIARTNVGYYSGYYSQETMSRVRRLYGFGHPIFG